MCFKKWFGKEEEVVEEVPVERKPVDELVQSINDLVVQLNLVVEENKKLEERVIALEKKEKEQAEIIEMLDNDRNKEYEATCAAKDQVVDLLNEKAELEKRLSEIMDLAKGK
jgi:ERCC4-type nuclease